METITYVLNSHGVTKTKTVPWSIGNQTVAEMEAVNGKIVCSLSNVPQAPAELIALLKSQLADTDYQALKFAEAQLTEEEYADMRAQRAQWRAEINELEEVLYSGGLQRISW